MMAHILLGATRPDDILIAGWDSGKPVAIDITVIDSVIAYVSITGGSRGGLGGLQPPLCYVMR